MTATISEALDDMDEAQAITIKNKKAPAKKTARRETEKQVVSFFTTIYI